MSGGSPPPAGQLARARRFVWFLGAAAIFMCFISVSGAIDLGAVYVAAFAGLCLVCLAFFRLGFLYTQRFWNRREQALRESANPAAEEAVTGDGLPLSHYAVISCGSLLATLLSMYGPHTKMSESVISLLVAWGLSGASGALAGYTQHFASRAPLRVSEPGRHRRH